MRNSYLQRGSSAFVNMSYINSKGYVKIGGKFVHRLVMKEELEKFDKPMQVHHIDGNKTNNSKSNLMVVDSLTHNRLEKDWKIIEGKWFKSCRKCNLFLEVSRNNFYFDKGIRSRSFCKKCSNLPWKICKRTL